MTSQYVSDVCEADFQQKVIDASRQNPVLVDFWAEWCGPCKTLSPLLDQLADEYRGAIRVAKVDTEKDQQLAETFRIQSIPTVCVFWQGQAVTSFQGALPKTELRRFIDQILVQTGGIAPETEEVPSDPTQAESHWRQELQSTPDNTKALLELSKLLLARGEHGEAKGHLNKIETGSVEHSAAQALLNTMALSSEVVEAGGIDAIRARLDADPDDQEAIYLLACAEASEGRFVQALDSLVSLIAKATVDLRDRSKKSAALVFEAAGRDLPEVEALRRKLTRLLF